MPGKGNFENRLAALGGEAALAGAKALLKDGSVLGAWRDRQGLLHGVFADPGCGRIDASSWRTRCSCPMT